MASGQSDGQRQTAPPESRWAYWGRVLRPLYWWLLLVLTLYGIRLHQRLSAQTNIKFTAIVRGESFNPESSAWLDDQPFDSGQHVRIGWHRLLIRAPNGYPFTTNLFVWYGGHDLGQIDLERTKGILVIHATPPAERLTIRGAEFATTLTNCNEFHSRVPTDRYSVEASYKYWNDTEQVPVSTDGTATYNFAPKFGTVAIAANYSDIAFELLNGKGALVESGYLPATITNLPVGRDYRLEATRKGGQHDIQFAVREGATTNLDVKYHYGAVDVESDPAGATVMKDGQKLGLTPLKLTEVTPGIFQFNLQLDEYEPAGATLVVSANQTNEYSTNLLSQHYVSEMYAARQFYAEKAYDRAAGAATEALKYKPGDEEATNLVHDAAVLGCLAKAEVWGGRNNFTNAIAAAKQALLLEPDNARARKLLADYTQREEQHLEAIRKREAELAEQARLRRERERIERMAQQRTQELRTAFYKANLSFENAYRFSNHELFGSNSVEDVASNIKSEMAKSSIEFQNLRLNWMNDHLFTLTARQHVGIGYREILMVGSQIRPGEVHVRFKVFEYEHPAKVSLLGGLVQIKTSVNATSQNPQIIANHEREFQQRIKNGIELASTIVQRAIAKR